MKRVMATIKGEGQGTARQQQGTIRRACCLGLAVLLMVLGASTALAQGITGSITGTVTDATGAVVPGATVTIRQTETNAIHTETTSEAGTYTITQLPPGHYTVTVAKASFKGYKQSPFVLQIDQTAQINATLTAGATQETVEVTASAEQIQTDDSSVGSVIDSQAIQNTPLNGRLSIVGLIALAPGVQNAGAQDQLATRGVTAAVGTGARNAYGSLGSTLDGVTNQEVTLQRGEGEVPSLDAIAEFKFIATGAPAEFNQPSQLVVVSASGTNQFHGGAFEYNRSKGTGAKADYLGTALAPPRPPYQRNEYGAFVSGPVILPHLYNGKDRSFFFFAYEGFRLTQSYTLNTAQPTLLERTGNFSELLIPGTNCYTGTVIKDPTTGNAYNNNTISNPNPVSQQLLNILYPKPTQSGCGTNTFEQVQELSKSSRISLRVDHKINDHNQIRFTWLRAFYGPNATNGPDSLQGGNAQDGEHNSNFILGYTHTFSPTLVLDTYGSYFHLPIYRTPQNYQTNFSNIIPGLGPELIQGAPQITINGGPSVIQPVSESGSKDLEQDGQINAIVTKVLAKHTIKAGFSYLYDNHWNDSASSPQRGSFSFSGRYTGFALADFIAGYPVSTGLPTPNNYIVRNISAQYGAFVQDDWKPIPKLTINVGLRYDLNWFRPNPYGNNSLYVPSLKKVVVFANAYPASALPGYLNNPAISFALAPQVGLSTNVFDYLGQNKTNVAPRFGFAYELMPRTVVRGAFGLYYNLLPSSYIDSASFGTLPFAGSQSYNNSNAGTAPAFSMSNPFAGTGAYGPNPGVSTQGKLVTPYTEEYNLAVEHQFGDGFDVRIGYVGQRNIHQNNHGGPGTTEPNINLLPTPQLGVSAQSTNLVQPFSAITQLIDPIYHSNMNSLQIGAHKQYRHGFTFGAEYQWIRVLGTENVQNPSGVAPNDSFGPISGIAPQSLTVNYSYALPFGRGQAFLGGAGNLVDKLVGGWQISGITDFQNGQPFSVTFSGASNVTGAVSGRADRIPGVPLYPANKGKGQWFNPNAFQVPLCYNSTGTFTCSNFNPATFPTSYALYGNSGYDLLRGPRFQDWDMSLQKNIAFKEKYKVQLRADSFNVFNHPSLGLPASNISSKTTVGIITSTSGTPGYEQRTVEFAAKFLF